MANSRFDEVRKSEREKARFETFIRQRSSSIHCLRNYIYIKIYPIKKKKPLFHSEYLLYEVFFVVSFQSNISFHTDSTNNVLNLIRLIWQIQRRFLFVLQHLSSIVLLILLFCVFSHTSSAKRYVLCAI